jgi:hypothetical protein
VTPGIGDNYADTVAAEMNAVARMRSALSGDLSSFISAL